MSHLNLRTSKSDENNILILKTKWKLDRSETTRKALELAATIVENEVSTSREELLKNSKFIGSEGPSEFTSTEYKDSLKKMLGKKYGT